MTAHSSLPNNSPPLSANRRYLAVCFPFLTTNRIERNPDFSGNSSLPLVATASLRNTIRILAANAAALRLKLTPGMTLTDARARYPGLLAVDADPFQDRTLLRQLAEFCERYTPLVALAPPDFLILDVSGCCHLFGGEAELAENLRYRLQTAGFTVHIAISGTVGCAVALAGSGKDAIIATGNEQRHLKDLPLAALRLPEKTVRLLDTFGLRRIGDLYERPRAPLTARFGSLLLTRLDQALGRVNEPISPLMPVPPYIAEQRFSEPIGRDEDVLGTVEQLAEQLAQLMEKRGQGGRSFICDLFRVDGAIRRLVIATGRPLRDPRAIRRLFSERLARVEDLDPGFGFDLIRLSADTSDTLADNQTELDDCANYRPDITELIDRFSLRFGRQSVLRLHFQDSHLPEQAIIALPAAEEIPDNESPVTPLPPQDSLSPLRPLRLFARPEPIDTLAEVPDGPPLRFRWRRRVHDVAISEGPERIAPEWWRMGCTVRDTRDYFRVETCNGTRLWLFREGLYGHETFAPRWFAHGLFA